MNKTYRVNFSKDSSYYLFIHLFIYSRPKEFCVKAFRKYIFLGYASYRDPLKGSFFIQHLCEVFEQHANDTPLSQMRFLIQQTLSGKVANLKGGVRAGMVADSGCDTLEHDIYFNPDIPFNEYLDCRRRKAPVEN